MGTAVLVSRGRLLLVTADAGEDKKFRVLLARIRALEVTVVNPLLMSLFEDYHDDALLHDDLASILRTAESYLFRRAACDVATNSLNKFFSSAIARLASVREDGGDIRETFEAILLGEEGTARRMPSDSEFERALRTRDCYVFKRGFYLLTTLENSHHEKDRRTSRTVLLPSSTSCRRTRSPARSGARCLAPTASASTRSL